MTDNTQSYTHNEAFALMQYESDNGELLRTIWNSRDGVTPFVVTIDGVECRHVRWNEDICAPGYQPADDDLVFITDHITADRWREIYRKRIEALPEFAPPEGPERDEFIERAIAEQMSSDGERGTPAMVTGREWRARQEA